MCGFIGAFNKTGKAVDLLKVEALIRHRGPDDRGHYEDPKGRFQVLFRRLSIIDLKSGAQPMLSDDGKICLVFNGEIYNYLELREGLRKAGVRFKTQSDTEVILRLFESHGPAAINKLEGMFSILIWNSEKGELLAFRDGFGIKPLYWTETAEHIFFSSEIKPILALNENSRVYDDIGICHYLAFGYTLDSTTVFRDIKKIRPGHQMTVTEKTVRQAPFWQIENCRQTTVKATDWIELFRETLRLHWRSDVKNGFFLSGGIDSSLLVSLAAQQFDSPIHTYTLQFSESIGTSDDESTLAEAVAQNAKTIHKTVTADRHDLLKNLDYLIWLFDEPLADSGLLAQHYLSRIVADDGCKVLLSGTGGDELFAGYTYHVPTSRENRLKSFAPFLRILGQTLGGEVGRKIERTGSFFSNPRYHYLHQNFVFSPNSGWLKNDAFKTKARQFDDPHWDPLSVRLACDIESYLANDLLLLTDRATMGASIEGRVPFLYRPLVCQALALSADQRTPNMVRKGLLRSLAKEFVPPEILHRPKKGFNSPIQTWVQDPKFNQVITQTIFSSVERQRPWLCKESLQNLNFHQRWTLFILELHARTFIDQRPAAYQNFFRANSA